MNPAAEDGGGLPTALAHDHAEAQDHAEQPGAASVPQRQAPTDSTAAASMPQQRRAPTDSTAAASVPQPRQAPTDSTAAASMPQRRAPIDGFAVASSIAGILGLIPLAAIFGPIALSRIGRTGARGRALAITGLALAGTWAVAVAIAVTLIITQRPPARAVVFPQIFSLRTGECINSAPNGTSGLHVLACGQPHDGEVFSTFRVADQHYPGATALREKASQGCASRLGGYMNPQLSTMLDESYFYPSSGAWAAGERTVVCTVRSPDSKLTGSVRTAPG
jgi:hypothetical protein